MHLLLFAALASPSGDFSRPWGEFSRRAAFSGVTEKVEIGTLGWERDTKSFRYWLRNSRGSNGVVTTRWADSDTCAEVNVVLRGLRSLAMPRPAPPGIDTPNNVMIVMDGVTYSLRAPAQFGRYTGEFTLSSNVETPLAHWADDSFDRLEKCWSDRQPERRP